MDYNVKQSAFLRALSSPMGAAAPVKTNKLGYVVMEGQVAYSYSRLQSLYSCPRKFQMREMLGAGSREGTIHTAFGHAFAAGLQELWTSQSIERATLALISFWDYDSFEDIWGKAKDKSLWCCIESLHCYYYTQHQRLNATYQIATIGDKPAVELFAYMQIGAHSNYQVHIDLILENRVSGALACVEIKTSAMPHQAANWQNSLQTQGYYALLTVLSKRYNVPLEPVVIYICLQTKKLSSGEDDFGFTVFFFDKSNQIASDFTLSLLQDMTTVEMYKEDGHFPKRGHSCVSWNQPCQYFGTCDSLPAGPPSDNHYESLTLADVDFYLTVDDLDAANNANNSPQAETNYESMDA